MLKSHRFVGNLSRPYGTWVNYIILSYLDLVLTGQDEYIISIYRVAGFIQEVFTALPGRTNLTNR